MNINDVLLIIIILKINISIKKIIFSLNSYY